MSRLERKRFQERRRRFDFKEALDNLMSTLLHNDTNFLREFHLRGKRTATRRVSNQEHNSSIDGENSLFNRVELINQAIFTIHKLAKDNDEFKNTLAELRPENKGVNEILCENRKAKRVRYHHGVGPIAIDDKEQPSNIDASAIGTVELQQEKVGKNPHDSAAVENNRKVLNSSNLLCDLVSLHQHHHQQLQQNHTLHIIQQLQMEKQRMQLLQSQLSGTIPTPQTALSSVPQQIFSQSNQPALFSDNSILGPSAESLLLGLQIPESNTPSAEVNIREAINFIIASKRKNNSNYDINF